MCNNKKILLVGLLMFIGGMAHAESFTVTANSNFTFSPISQTIYPGDSVIFTRAGGFHNVVADDNSFRCANGCDGTGGNGNLSSSWTSFTLSFSNAGNVPYYCEAHGSPGGNGMSGTIVVDGDGIFHSFFDR